MPEPRGLTTLPKARRRSPPPATVLRAGPGRGSRREGGRDAWAEPRGPSADAEDESLRLPPPPSPVPPPAASAAPSAPDLDGPGSSLGGEAVDRWRGGKRGGREEEGLGVHEGRRRRGERGGFQKEGGRTGGGPGPEVGRPDPDSEGAWPA